MLNIGNTLTHYFVVVALIIPLASVAILGAITMAVLALSLVTTLVCLNAIDAMAGLILLLPERMQKILKHWLRAYIK